MTWVYGPSVHGLWLRLDLQPAWWQSGILRMIGSRDVRVSLCTRGVCRRNRMQQLIEERLPEWLLQGAFPGMRPECNDRISWRAHTWDDTTRARPGGCARLLACRD
jgi:hypothetical protein